MTTQEVAEFWGVSKGTVIRWGTPTYKTVDGVKRVHRKAQLDKVRVGPRRVFYKRAQVVAMPREETSRSEEGLASTG
jgi:hypothetical protein